MKVELSLKELREAIKEWCDKRGIIVEPENITIDVVVVSNVRQYGAVLHNVEVPVKEGPYR